MNPALHILLVDDSRDDRELARRAVAGEFPDARFSEAGTAAEFAPLADRRYDGVITDYPLGWSNGLEILRRLKAIHPEQPVIMFTNTGSEEICATGMKSGLSDYIVKRKEEFPKLPAAVRAARDLLDVRNQVRERDADIRDLLERERSARNEAVRAGHLKDEFLATVSHELRTPLSAILGWAHLLQLGRLQRAEGLEAFAIIERNARAQAKLIDDILDLSRIVSGTLRIDLGPLDLLASVATAIAAVRPQADAKSIRITTRLDPVPPPIRGDSARIQQIMTNLLINAVKFTARHGNVWVTLERAASSVQFTVRDDGVGIPADFLPHIFDRFRQSEVGPSRRHGGLGIGLSVVKNLVEIHGGTVQAYSDGPNTGSRFVVSFPVAVMLEQEVRQVESATAETPAPHPLGGMRILAVDDDPDTLDIIARVLSAYGAQVSSAASAAEGRSLLESGRFDVLLSDIGMPGEDGFRFIGGLRKSDGPNARIPAASVTAFARGQDRERALLAGFDAHLVKPIEPGELVAVVLSLLKRTGTRQ